MEAPRAISLAVLSCVLLVTSCGAQSGPIPATAPPIRADARNLDPRQLLADPKAYLGVNLSFQGKTLNVQQQDSFTWVQLLAQVPGRSTTESIVFEFRPKVPELLKDDCYRMYGVVAGTQEVTRTLTGAKETVPYLNGYLWERISPDRFGIGCETATLSTTQSNVFKAELKASNETPPITDAEASCAGTATVTFTSTSAKFDVVISGCPSSTAINIGHIHEGAAGVAGGVKISTGLAAGDLTLTGGGVTFSRTATADAALITAIMANPAGYYVNFHSTAQGGGVIRGQLTKA